MKPVLVLILLTLLNPLAAAMEQTDNTALIDMTSPIVAEIGDIKFRQCHLEANGRERKVQCAWHEVPENPSDQAGPKIELFIARLPAKRQSQTPDDAMLFIAGGPGQAASEAYLFIDQTFSSLNTTRDFYLIDQRGTGHSNLLDCPNLLNSEDLMGIDYSAQKIQTLTRNCLAELPFRVQDYTTDNTVMDFESVRSALQLPQWNLLGVSYGTRVSTQYMRNFPGSLRTVVLDSVVPPEHALGSEVALRSQYALNKLIARCASDPSCAAAIPNLQGDIDYLLQSLERNPIEVTYENFTTGRIEQSKITHDHIALLIRMYLYNAYSLALLPPMLHEAAANKNFAPLARATNHLVKKLGQSIAIGLHNSIMCTEEFPYLQIDEALPERNSENYMGADLINVIKDICAVWPKGELLKTMKMPLASEIPTLLFSGEFDPITPPEYASETIRHLSRAKHFILHGQGHNVSGIGCAPHIVNNFVVSGSQVNLKAECLERVTSPPLFINFNGSAP